ncbi:MAG: AP endonuclease, family 2 [Promethearchaeota archaeon CR_4]|nr:MAG: AP endonuclease, family 2 [Candidatus Lokiarchaeota archaeon CR_4]
MPINRIGLNSFAAFLLEVTEQPNIDLGEIIFSSIKRAILYAKQYDFDYVEVALDHPLLGNAELKVKLRDFIRDEGLAVNVHAPFVDLTICSHDPNIRAASLRSVFLAIDFAKEVRAGAVTFHPGQRIEPIAHVGDFYFTFLVNSLAEIMRSHPNSSVRLCLENMPTDRKIFGTIDEIKRIMGLPGLSNLWLTYDSSHMYTTKQDPNAFWAELHTRIGNVHLVDNRFFDRDPHIPLGQGKVDFKNLARLITQYRYPHDILVELHSLYQCKRGRSYFQNLLAGKIAYAD